MQVRFLPGASFLQRISMNTSNNNLVEFIKDKLTELRKFIEWNIRIILPIAVGVVAILALVIGLAVHNSHKQDGSSEAEVSAPEKETLTDNTIGTDAVITVPEVALEEDAYPEVNELIEKYYAAVSEGDIDTVKTLNNHIDDTEAIRIRETAKYIDKYNSIKVYTKPGPAEGTYLAFAYSEIKFLDYDKAIPGLEEFYICTDENGKLYINFGEESESVINYITEASLQDDVVDLNNEVAGAYNNMLTEDENLSVFLMDLTDSIDTAVGESLAQAEGDETPANTTEEADATADNKEENAGGEISKEVVTTVKATTTVNIRSSDSETADKLGKASEGQEFKLIEKKGNGWSEIDYNGKSAFIKSEFLEDSKTETVITVNDNTASADAGDSETDDNSQTGDNGNKTTETAKAADDSKTKDTESETTAKSADSEKTAGTVIVQDSVRIRSTPSTDGEKIATVYGGEKLELIEKMDNGWSKIKYKGQVAYVKSEYVK